LRLRLKGARGDGLELNRPGRVTPLLPSLSCAEIITALSPLVPYHPRSDGPGPKSGHSEPGPRACLKRRSAARLSLPRQTCSQGSERRLQALGHCFRAAAPQAHFLLTFWGASQKVRRCKSATRSPTTGKTTDADARPKPTALLPLPLIHKKESALTPTKPTTSPRPSSSPHPPTLGQSRPEERSFGNRGLEPVSSAEAKPD
jgi:hypothetical protein